MAPATLPRTETSGTYTPQDAARTGDRRVESDPGAPVEWTEVSGLKRLVGSRAPDSAMAQASSAATELGRRDSAARRRKSQSARSSSPPGGCPPSRRISSRTCEVSAGDL